MNKFILTCVCILLLLLFISSVYFLHEGMAGGRSRHNDHFSECSNEETYYSEIGTIKLKVKYDLTPYEVNDISNYSSARGDAISDMKLDADEIEKLQNDSTTSSTEINTRKNLLVAELKRNNYKKKEICEIIFTKYADVNQDNEKYMKFIGKHISVIFNNDSGRINVTKSSSELDYDISFLDKEESTGDAIIYQGKLGTIHVKIINGMLKVIDHSTSFSNDINAGSFYGPNGDELKVKKEGDELIIKQQNIMKTVKRSKTSKDEDNKKMSKYWTQGIGAWSDEDDNSDYILKSKIVPPVCPACPSLNYCGNSGNNKSSSSVDTTDKVNIDADDSNINSNNTANTNINYNITSTKNATKEDNTEDKHVMFSKKPPKQGPVQNTRVPGSLNNSGVIYPNLSQQTQSVDSVNEPPIGSYLGNNNLVTNPMPILNDFSTFGL